MQKFRKQRTQKSIEPMGLTIASALKLKKRKVWDRMAPENGDESGLRIILK